MSGEQRELFYGWFRKTGELRWRLVCRGVTYAECSQKLHDYGRQQRVTSVDTLVRQGRNDPNEDERR